MNNIDTLNNILTQFKIAAYCKHFGDYNNSFYYDFSLNPGTRIQVLEKYANEISLAIKAPSKPLIKILPNEGIVRFEYVKPIDKKVNLFELGRSIIRPAGKLQCLLGETIYGDPLWFDMSEAPHTLIGGTTGSGKTTILHSIVSNLLVQGNNTITIMDPKGIEFSGYSRFPSIEVVYEYNDCLAILQSLCGEMDRRYATMREYGITGDYFSKHILIIDEFSDLIMQDKSRKFYEGLCRLAQKSRSAGIHIVIATQRPSATIIDGSIKANFSCRISCRVASGTDSKIVLDRMGAEELYGKGDAIIKSEEWDYQRFKVAYTNLDEISEYFGEV